MRKIFVIGVVLGLKTSILTAAPTAADINQAAREADRIQREQQIRQQQEVQEELLKRPKTVIEFDSPSSVGPKADGGDTACRDVKQIVIDGASLLPDEERESITGPFLNTCMSLFDIERLLTQVTSFYINKGYVGARVYIQPQELNQGVLKLTAIEGIVEKIQLNDGGQNSVNLTTAFPDVEGNVLNLRDIEQGLDQVNRLLSNNAKMELAPGEEAGGTIVSINNNPARRVRGGLSFDNTGSSSTGENQVGLSVSVDNLLNLNDLLSLSHRRTIASDSSTQHARSETLFYAIPYGPLTFSLLNSRSEYASAFTSAANNVLVSSGDSVSTTVAVDYVAYRDVRNRVNFNSSLTRKTNENFLNDVFLGVSSRTLSIFDLVGNWSVLIDGGSVSLNLGHSMGLDIMGALKDQDGIPDSAPKAQYKKWTTGASLSKFFKIGAQDYAFTSLLSAQYASDALYGTEQFLIGSPFNVRGFRNSSISGDRGYYTRNELGMPLYRQFGDTTVLLRPYVGYDFGDIKDRFVSQGGHLSGATIGVAVSNKNFSMDAFASKPLSMPDRLDDEGTQGFVRLSLNF